MRETSHLLCLIILFSWCEKKCVPTCLELFLQLLILYDSIVFLDDRLTGGCCLYLGRKGGASLTAIINENTSALDVKWLVLVL